MGINFPMFLDLQGTWPHFQHEFIDPIIPGLLIPSEIFEQTFSVQAEYYCPGLSLLSSAILWVRGAFRMGMPPNLETAGYRCRAEHDAIRGSMRHGPLRTASDKAARKT